MLTVKTLQLNTNIMLYLVSGFCTHWCMLCPLNSAAVKRFHNASRILLYIQYVFVQTVSASGISLK